VFDAIFNEPRAKFPVSSGFDPVQQTSPTFALLNDMQQHSYKPFGDDVRPDMLTYYSAKEYIKAKSPRVVYIAFDETDDYAHGGRYDQYIQSAHLTDQWIGDLWETIQAMPQYRNKTTLIVTTDHGRGNAVKKEWTSHGAKISGADQIWMAFLGKGVASIGEIKKGEQIYQAQIAQTVALLLGHRYVAPHPIEKEISLSNGK
jgi:bisphosphoglycerate-independent phosphoglycerate mutase (AlkP superfamily)